MSQVTLIGVELHCNLLLPNCVLSALLNTAWARRSSYSPPHLCSAWPCRLGYLQLFCCTWWNFSPSWGPGSKASSSQCHQTWKFSLLPLKVCSAFSKHFIVVLTSFLELIMSILTYSSTWLAPLSPKKGFKMYVYIYTQAQGVQFKKKDCIYHLWQSWAAANMKLSQQEIQKTIMLSHFVFSPCIFLHGIIYAMNV